MAFSLDGSLGHRPSGEEPPAFTGEGVNRMLRIKTWMASEEGATAVEYGLMVALIAVVIISAVTLLGGNLSNLFSYIAGEVAP